MEIELHHDETEVLDYSVDNGFIFIDNKQVFGGQENGKGIKAKFVPEWDSCCQVCNKTVTQTDYRVVTRYENALKRNMYYMKHRSWEALCCKCKKKFNKS